MKATAPKNNSMVAVFSLRDFRLLFSGATTSLLGDHFALIATPWLVLKMTGDPLALGMVLALEGIPRAIFMLLGGAITDRISPRVIMLVSDGTPKAMLGRMMRMMVLSNTGLVPISQAISGAISRWSLTWLFAGAGILILLVTVWAASQPGLKVLSDSMMAEKPAGIPGPVPPEDGTI